jgi:hypothetical protein
MHFQQFKYIGLLLILLSGLAFGQEKGPNVIQFVPPSYPAAAMSTYAKGEVLVRVVIRENGKVGSAVAETGDAILRPASEAAAKNWIFSRVTSAADHGNRSVDIKFVYTVKENNDFKYNYKNPTIKMRFRPPYELELIITFYPRVDI